jgi:hypothetical protein
MDGQLDFGTTTLNSSTIESQILSLLTETGFAVQITWTGTPTGNFLIQGSCDPGQVGNGGVVSGVSNWATISGTTVAAGGAPGSLLINLQNQYYRWFQVVYQGVSGTGTITSANYSFKGSRS